MTALEEALEVLRERRAETLAEVSTDWDLVEAIDLVVGFVELRTGAQR